MIGVNTIWSWATKSRRTLSKSSPIKNIWNTFLYNMAIYAIRLREGRRNLVQPENKCNPASSLAKVETSWLLFHFFVSFLLSPLLGFYFVKKGRKISSAASTKWLWIKDRIHRNEYIVFVTPFHPQCFIRTHTRTHHSIFFTPSPSKKKKKEKKRRKWYMLSTWRNGCVSAFKAIVNFIGIPSKMAKGTFIVLQI